jgi:hypothetical protein
VDDSEVAEAPTHGRRTLPAITVRGGGGRGEDGGSILGSPRIGRWQCGGVMASGFGVERQTMGSR